MRELEQFSSRREAVTVSVDRYTTSALRQTLATVFEGGHSKLKPVASFIERKFVPVAIGMSFGLDDNEFDNIMGAIKIGKQAYLVEIHEDNGVDTSHKHTRSCRQSIIGRGGRGIVSTVPLAAETGFDSQQSLQNHPESVAPLVLEPAQQLLTSRILLDPLHNESEIITDLFISLRGGPNRNAHVLFAHPILRKTFDYSLTLGKK